MNRLLSAFAILPRMRIPKILAVSTCLTIGAFVLHVGTITIFGTEVSWWINSLLFILSTAILIHAYKLEWPYIFSIAKRTKRHMDEEYKKTEAGKAEEARHEKIIGSVVEDFGKVPIASRSVYKTQKTVIRVELSRKYAPWHWKLREWMVDRLLDGFNRGLLPERLCKWLGGLLGWTWKD